MKLMWRGCVCFCAWASSKRCGWELIAPGRFIGRCELLNWRDAQRQLKALIKARTGDVVVLKSPGGEEALEILDVHYGPAEVSRAGGTQ